MGAVIVSRRELDRLRGKQASFVEAYQKFAAKFGGKGAGVGKEFARTLRDRSPGRNVTS